MKLKKFLILLILPLIFLTGCKSNELDKVSKDLNTYNLEIAYNDDHTLNVKQTLNYINKEDTPLENLMLHLYPRSFRQGASASVVSSLNYNKCYYNGISYGDLEISALKVNEIDKDIIITGNDDDILDVKFDTPLNTNENTNIYIEYKVTIPNINHRFGYGEDTINLGNFYPVACVYEDGNYHIDCYHYNGDPFYSEVANYNVTLTTPNNLVLASSGDVISQDSTDNLNTYTINAKAVRDFAFVLSDKFNVVTGNINNVKVNYYYYKNQHPNECLQASLDSVSTFNRLFGEYPYNTLNVVESNFVHGGMEYPNLVLISDAVDVQSDFINVIVHEIAHQWWYGIVGNNEFQYGWLDESLTEYSTLLFYDENPNYNVNTKELIKNTTNSYVTFVDIYKKVFDTVDTTMNRKLNEFTNESEYVYIAYVKGMLMYDSLDELLGREKFIKALQRYFEENKYGISTPEKLVDAFEQTTGSDLSTFFDSWFNGKVQIYAMN